MISVGAFEAKTHLGQLLERVERGEEITITRRGRAVARLVPVAVGHDREAALATFRRRRERAARLRLGKFDWTEWKAYVDEGRPQVFTMAGLVIDSSTVAWHDTLRLAEARHLTVYDAACLELAQRRKLSLVTLDSALSVAAGALGVGLRAGRRGAT